jgi:hypothetical protein
MLATESESAMRIISLITPLATVTFTGITMLAGGCGTVSRSAYLDTAYAPPLTSPSSYRVGGEAAASDTPKVIVVRHAETGETFSSATTTGAAASPPAATGMARGAEALTAERQRYVATVNNDVDALSTRLGQLTTQAKIKGAAGEAALDPHARAFKHTVEEIQSTIDSARDATDEAWVTTTTTLDRLVKQAKQTVDDATRDVEAVPVVK